MTTPHGHPDFQDITQAQSPNLFPSFSTTFALGHTLTPIIPCASWGSLNLAMTASAGSAQITIKHYADAAGTQVVSQDSWPLPNGHALTVRTPLHGLYVAIDVNCRTATPLTAQSWATLQSTTPDNLHYPTGVNKIAANAQTIPAATSNFYTHFNIAGGIGSLYFLPADALGKLHVSINEIDETGAFIDRVTDIGSPIGPVNVPLVIPDQLLQLVVQNTDAGGVHTCEFSLIVAPL